MTRKGINAGFALGGITGGTADLHKKGLINTVVDVQSFDGDAAESLRTSSGHVEISANEYANPPSKAAYVDRVNVVILSALEIDLDFYANVITDSDGVMRGASGGHCDVRLPVMTIEELYQRAVELTGEPEPSNSPSASSASSAIATAALSMSCGR